MASLADDFFYKLLDEAEYVEFGFMTRMEDSTNSRRELNEPYLKLLFQSIVHTAQWRLLCQNDKIWSSLNF